MSAIKQQTLFAALARSRPSEVSNSEVAEGEIYGFLGPNGAGKSTIVRILTTLLQPTSGSGSVLGHDVVREPTTVRRLIGVALPKGRPRPQADRPRARPPGQAVRPQGGPVQRVTEVTELVGLTDAIDRRIQTYSGGMSAASTWPPSLLHRPRVLFLDEPTTGLDPLSRALVWDRIRELRERFEDHHLPHRPVPGGGRRAGRRGGDHRPPGQIVRQGTPEVLKAEVGSDVIDVAVEEREFGAARAAVAELQASGGCPRASCAGPRRATPCSCPTGPENWLSSSAVWTRPASASPGRSACWRPTLDDVFLAATGGRMAAADQDGQGGDQAREPRPAAAGRRPAQ